MKVTRTNIFTGAEATLELSVTQEQLDDHASGTLIQHAMPNLTADEREFLITGILPGTWDEFFPEEE